jgi:hypothetical protein
MVTNLNSRMLLVLGPVPTKNLPPKIIYHCGKLECSSLEVTFTLALYSQARLEPTVELLGLAPAWPAKVRLG